MPKKDFVLIVREGQPQELASETITREEARALRKAGRGYFTDSGRAFHIVGQLAQAQFEEIISYAAHELAAGTSLSDADMLANVGLAKRARTGLTPGAMKRAQQKVRHWLSPLTADARAPLPRGSWAKERALNSPSQPVL